MKSLQVAIELTYIYGCRKYVALFHNMFKDKYLNL